MSGKVLKTWASATKSVCFSTANRLKIFLFKYWMKTANRPQLGLKFETISAGFIHHKPSVSHPTFTSTRKSIARMESP